jgi:Protein of unknown function (DUF4239)
MVEADMSWSVPATKIRQLIRWLVSAWVAYIFLHFAGFYAVTATDAEGLGLLIQLIGSIYAVLLAFTIFVIWGQFTEVDNCVIRECNSFGDILRFSQYMNADAHAAIRRSTKNYVRQVLDHEWGALGDGRKDKRAEDAFVQFLATVVETAPRNETEAALHARLLNMAQTTSERRNERIAKTLTRIPPTLAALVNTVAAVLVLLIFVYPFRQSFIGAACFTLSTCVIWLANLVMMDTDNPVKGIWNVSPQPFADLRL